MSLGPDSKITLGGKEYVVPAMSFSVMRKAWPQIKECLEPFDTSATTHEMMDEDVRRTHLILQVIVVAMGGDASPEKGEVDKLESTMSYGDTRQLSGFFQELLYNCGYLERPDPNAPPPPSAEGNGEGRPEGQAA